MTGGGSESYQTTEARTFNRIDSASSATTHSSLSGQASPKIMPPPLSKRLSQGDSSVSPSSLPPTPPLYHKSPGTARASESIAQGRSVDPPYQNSGLTQGQSLPRILPPDIGNESTMVHGILPPLVTDTAILRTPGTPQANIRRSQNAPAPFLGRDKSKSSGYSSRSSDVSGSSVAGSSLFTPITPVDETGSHRNLLLPLPSSILSNSISTSSFVDSSQQAFPPTVLPQSPQKYKTLPLLKSSYAPSLTGTMTIPFIPVLTPVGSPLTQYEIESSLRSMTDIPNERHSMRNLSLGKSSQPSHHLRSHSRELQDAQQNQGPLFPPRQSQILPREIPSRELSTLGKDHRSLRPQTEGNMTEAHFDPQADPLSVLAYAGRIVDRESRKPP